MGNGLLSFYENGSNNLIYRDENQTCYVENPFKSYTISDCNNYIWNDVYFDDSQMSHITRTVMPYDDSSYQESIIYSSGLVGNLGEVSVHTEL